MKSPSPIRDQTPFAKRGGTEPEGLFGNALRKRPLGLFGARIVLNRPLTVFRAPFEPRQNTLGSVPLTRNAPDDLARALGAKAGTDVSQKPMDAQTSPIEE